MSAKWPTSIAAILDLLLAINNTKVTLNVDAGIGDTTLTVDDASPLSTSGFLTFDDNLSSPESVSYTGKSGNNLTGVTRGADGTAAGTHVTGSHLEMRWNAAYHNTLATEMIAVEQNLSDRFGVGTNIVVPAGRTFTLAATTNQIILGTTNTTTISSTAPASSRTYTIPDAGSNVQFVMAGGTQTIAGAKTFSSAVIINPTTNQLVLGVTNTTTISATAPASSAIYTIPDVGTTANFVMSAGTQTVGGAKTFSSAVTINPTTNQIVLGVTNTTTINSVAPASSRTYTIPDAGGAASFVMTAGTQTIAGATTFSVATLFADGTVSLPGVAFASDTDCGMYRIGTNNIGIAVNGVIQANIGVTGVILRGTTTNDSAAAGMIGETISARVDRSTPVNAFGNGTYGDVMSISLTAGDWDVSVLLGVTPGTTQTGFELGVSVTTGNSATGLVYGDNQLQINMTTTSLDDAATIPTYRISLSGTTIYYFKALGFYTVGTPKFYGRISARRIR